MERRSSLASWVTTVCCTVSSPPSPLPLASSRCCWHILCFAHLTACCSTHARRARRGVTWACRRVPPPPTAAAGAGLGSSAIVDLPACSLLMIASLTLLPHCGGGTEDYTEYLLSSSIQSRWDGPPRTTRHRPATASPWLKDHHRDDDVRAGTMKLCNCLWPYASRCRHSLHQHAAAAAEESGQQQTQEPKQTRKREKQRRPPVQQSHQLRRECPHPAMIVVAETAAPPTRAPRSSKAKEAAD